MVTGPCRAQGLVCAQHILWSAQLEHSAVLECVFGSWSPKIGDPNVTGWLTVLFYLVAGVLCVAAWRKLRGDSGGRFWAVLAMLLLALAVNKQLDLQSALTATGKCLAQAQGWYGQRRVVQLIFLGGIAVAGIAAMSVGLWQLRGQLRRHAIALIGTIILLVFVMARALSFHHIDRILGVGQFGIPNNFLFENGGLFLIAVNAILILLGSRTRRKISWI